jgi:nucleoside phosphorylase
MKFLLIEDQDGKRQNVAAEIAIADSNPEITVADNLEDARALILSEVYDLIIFDIYLPVRKGEQEQDISDDLIRNFSRSKNYNCETIALTMYNSEDISLAEFNNHGITVVSYDDIGRWKQCLQQKIKRIAAKPRCDFLIFCALSKERAAYVSTSATLGGMQTISGLNCQEISIGSFHGFCITPQRMGLVNMAITVSKAIELFNPKATAMSGICAGVSGETNLLDLVVGDVCWEYQTGKFKDNRFLQEPYQAPVSRVLRVHLEQAMEAPELLAKLKSGLFDTELKASKMSLGMVSSGSAVVADVSKMAAIAEQHRKWSALEMEMYSFYEASAQSLCQPLYFGAKAVVDMGDASKGDTLHVSACVLSARFVVEMLSSIFAKIEGGEII